MSKIYLVPEGGDYEGKLLVFDIVESMSHVRNSKIPQHPVEALGRSQADHRFRDPVKIQMTVGISDNWKTSLTEEPDPEFKNEASHKQAAIRDKMQADFPKGTLVNKVVNNILDKQENSASDLSRALEQDTFWISQARLAIALEKDALDRTQEKRLASTGVRSNNSSLGTQINTITQAKEMLNSLDQENTIVTLVSLYETYPGLVLLSFTNVLRNGPDRGAYWVNLTLEEQQLSKVELADIIVDQQNTEAADSVRDKGKKNRVTLDAKDPVYKGIITIWDRELANYESRDPKIASKVRNKITTGETEKTASINEVVKVYASYGSDVESFNTYAASFFKGSLRRISTKYRK